MIGLVLLLQAQVAIPPAARQIEWAVEAAPDRMRADATVVGYAPDGSLTTLRKGTGLMVCLADDPTKPNHHVSCYHRDLDPFMARGRELRAKGLKDPAIDSVRMVEIKAGKIKMPSQPAALYQLIAKPGGADVATGKVTGGQTMFVLYIPFATTETTGLSLRPIPGVPWLMDPGQPWAHVMVTP
jgi:hypothetical protein